jgi:hypothetical protein
MALNSSEQAQQQQQGQHGTSSLDTGQDAAGKQVHVAN